MCSAKGYLLDGFSDGAWTHILFSSGTHCYGSNVVCDSNVACDSSVGIIFKYILYVTRKYHYSHFPCVPWL